MASTSLPIMRFLRVPSRWQPHSGQSIQYELLNDPTLVNGLLDANLCLVDVHPAQVKVVWEAVFNALPDRAPDVLKALGRHKLAPKLLVSSPQLLHAPTRLAWLEEIFRRNSIPEAIRLIVEMTADLLGKYQEPLRVMSYVEHLDSAVIELTNHLTPSSRKTGLAERVVVDMRAKATRFTLDEQRSEHVFVLLGSLGLKVNEPRMKLYPNPKHKNGARLTVHHPNLAHELLWVAWKKRQTCPLARALVNVGGDWQQAWNDPQIGNTARKELATCPAILRERLKTVAQRPKEGIAIMAL